MARCELGELLMQRFMIGSIVLLSLFGRIDKAQADKKDPKIKLAANRGLDWLLGSQSGTVSSGDDGAGG